LPQRLQTIYSRKKARKDAKKSMGNGRLILEEVSFFDFLSFLRLILMKTINELCDLVRETSFAIHQFHRHGHLEKIYENALAHRLGKAGLNVRQQHPIQVFDEDGTILGDFYADLIIEGRIVVELKAVKSIADEHVAQLLGYLRSSRMEHGLLINFGAPVLFVKKFVMSN
jgi:GxxExxY protein